MFRKTWRFVLHNKVIYSTRPSFWYSFKCWFPLSLCACFVAYPDADQVFNKSRSILIVYWLGDLKLINAYSTNNIQNINHKRIFGGFRIIFQCAHISFYYTLYSMILLKIANQHPDMQISHALKANEVCPWMQMRKLLLAMLMLVIYFIWERNMLILIYIAELCPCAVCCTIHLLIYLFIKFQTPPPPMSKG